MLYTLDDLAAHIAPDRLELGWRWYRDGKVSAPNIQRGGEIVTAFIRHSYGYPLRLYIRTSKVGGAITISGECSCATKHNCEHVAAVLLQALKDCQALPDTLTGTPGARKGARQAARGSPSVADPAATQVLLYLLRPDEHVLFVEPKVARRLKHGGYSIGRQFNPSRTLAHTPARFLQPQDFELLTTLDQLSFLPHLGFELSGARRSDTLFKDLLATGRCHLAGLDLGSPLRQGAKRPIRFDWQIDEYAFQRIAGQTTPTSEALLRLPVLWYLDRAAGECGPVDSELSDALVQDLFSLPAVAPGQVVKLRKALSKAYPAERIPALRAFHVDKLPRVRPVPSLCLSTQKTGQGTEHSDTYDIARLRFDYGGIEVDPDGPDTRLDGTRVVRVRRDRKAEAAARQLLREMGLAELEFSTSETSAAHFAPSADDELTEAEAWLDFQGDHLPALRKQGWRITYAHFRYRLIEPTHWYCEIDSLERRDWFSVGLGVEVEGKRVDLLPILLEVLRKFPRGQLEQKDGSIENLIVTLTGEQEETQLLCLPVERVLPLLHTVLEIYGDAASSNPDRLQLSRTQLARLSALEPIDRHDQVARLQWLGDDDARQLLERLRNLEGIPEATPPAGLAVALRPYQQQGLSWLQFLREYRFAGILADDMGLGKTLQALAHLLLEKESGRADRPSLVVAPTSLMFNWRHEARRFTPQLRVLVLQGPQRGEQFATIAEHDLVITTYPLLARDQHALLAQRYHLLILDEAQVVKNAKAQTSQLVRKFDARHRLCLTGTPMENHLGELWSLFDFLLPGLLGQQKRFRQLFRTPIEQHGSEPVAQRLSRRIRPFLLRRTKQQVAAELPQKIEIVQPVTLQGQQRELYESVRLAMHQRVRAEIERQGLARSHVVVLDALLKLRQVCCDPRLLASERARGVGISAKLDMLMELLPEMVEEGRRILVFSQFTRMLGLIESEVQAAGFDYVKLTGQTRDRETPVRRFQQGEVPLFLISLKAGGVGLNLTAADAVVHYDPWWNPAVERQATDRAHRIGQEQSVFVYKLLCEGTVEEKMQAMQQRKQALADGLYQQGDEQRPQWSNEDLNELFEPLGDMAEEP
jgi:SNF2 family DNA or RNA helicase